MIRQLFIKLKQQQLLTAVQRKDYHAVKTFLAENDVTACFNEETEYHLLKNVIEKQDDQMFQLFLNKNPDLTMSDAKGNTLLMTALYANQENKAFMLLQKGCQAETVNVRGSHPLLVAAGLGMTKIVDEILKQNIPVDRPGPHGITALMRAAGNNQLKTVEFLLQKGANVHLQNNSGQNALIYALQFGTPAVVSCLLHAGSDVNLNDKSGQTALFYALSRPEMHEVVPALFRKGADVNVVNCKGETPLSAAVRSGNVKLVKTLIENGAQIDVISHTGETPLLIAKQRKLTEIAALLKQSLFQADEKTSAQIVKWFESDKDFLNKLRFCHLLASVYQKMLPGDRKKVLTQIQPFLTPQEKQNLMTERIKS